MLKFQVPAVFINPEGDYSPSIPVVSGVYAPDVDVNLITDADGRVGLLFPASREWVEDWEYGGLGPSPFPWPGWHTVDQFAPFRALSEFIKVQDAKSARHFAQRYGPLWACALHPFPCLWRGVNAPADTGRRCAWVNVEPLDWWLVLAQRIRATLEAATRLRDGEPLQPKDWEGMGWKVPERPFERIEAEALFVTSVVNGELHRYGVTLSLNTQFAPELNAGLGFVPALWQQAVATIGGGRALAICSSCGVPYVRKKRAARRGQHNYCPPCNDAGARQRLSRRKSTTGHPSQGQELAS